LAPEAKAPSDAAADRSASVSRTERHSPPERTPEQIKQVVLGLLPATLLGAIDQSMVPIALLTIGRELNDLSLIAWVMAGYLVAGTIATPVYGKLSDLHGRRRMLLIAMSTAMVGSLLCAVSVSMPMLIAARVLQGLGSGALFALSQTAIADFVSGPARGRYQGYFSGVFASSALAAPLLGGYLTEHLGWRSIFLANLPIALFAIFMVRRVLPSAGESRRDAGIDWLGAALLAAGIAVILIALTRIGQGEGWFGTSTLSLIALGVTLLGLWGWRESDAVEPILPLALFRNRTVMACCLVTALTFFVLVGCTVLLPLSMQTVGDARADQVAVRLIALTLAVPAGAFTSGRVMLKVPQIGWIAAGGCLMSSLALLGIAFISPKAGVGLAMLMIPLGLGVGFTLPVLTVAAQMAVGPAMVGVATATVSLFRSFGGVIGIAVLTSLILAAVGNASSILTADRAALGQAFTMAFSVAAGACGLACAIALIIPAVTRLKP
jgi:MFS family permease